MQYWSELLTQKSWEVLQKLSKEVNFILIGGWATYLWTKASKSRDIDIVVDFATLGKLKKRYEMRKNDRLRKYEIKIDEVDVDVYVPHYSNLAIPVEDLDNYITRIENLRTIEPEALLILKQGVEMHRRHSVKGKKDQLDIIALLMHSIDVEKYLALLKKYGKEDYIDELMRIIKTFDQYEYLNINPRQYKLWKNKIIPPLKSS
ncbi:MAG: hypothetical protein QMC78_02800 [Methanocellales archaeon]|nr:hypothetical protein [Methanocellales archaeon]